MHEFFQRSDQKRFKPVQGHSRRLHGNAHPVTILKKRLRIFGHILVHKSNGVENHGPAGMSGKILIGNALVPSLEHLGLQIIDLRLMVPQATMAVLLNDSSDIGLSFIHIQSKKSGAAVTVSGCPCGGEVVKQIYGGK